MLLLTLCLAAPFFGIGGISLATTALAYGALALGASIKAARRTEWKVLPLLPIAFAMIHLAYGSGFLIGLAKFWNRWGEHETCTNHSTLLPDAKLP